MNGIEASARIKKHPGLGVIPFIVLVTAYGREEIMRQAEAAGLDGFLLKPISPSMLFDTIMQAFGKDAPKEFRTAHEKDREAEVLRDIHGAHVLLVEDNEINQQVAQGILDGAGLKVSIANNGQEAVTAVEQHKYDAVLMDVQMPVMDGYEATREIRKDSRFKDLPIIAMTAHAMSGDHEKSLDAGMNDHVTKPIDPQQLFAALLRWIQPHKVRPTAQPPETEIPGKSTKVLPRGTTDRAAPPADEETFPDSLPGFDLADGLNRLQGNHQLYRKLLLNFFDTYSGIAAEIRESLDTKDMEQAHSLVHGLKGVAGNLAATDLQAASTELEKLVKDADKDNPPSPDALSPKMTILEKALNQALDAVQTLRPLDQKDVTPPEDETGSLPPELAREAAKRLREAVDIGDVMGLVSIAEDLNARSDAFKQYKDKIVQLSENFDFDGVLKLVDELEQFDQ